jgi:hypothetical protein
MKRMLLAALAAVSLGSAAQAATPADAEQAAILAVVERFFAAMKTQDAKTLAEVSLSDGVYTIQQQRPDGGYELRRPTTASVQESLAKRSGLDEHIWSPVVLRRGPIAVVWAPYQFKLEGASHHCGVDVFELAEADGTWKIASLMWTAEPGACAELGVK